MRVWRQSCAAIVLLCLCVYNALAAPTTNKQTERKINILNDSGSKFEIYWINPQTRAGVVMTPAAIMHGANFPLNSFVGHEFEVREFPSASTGLCKSEDQVCRTTLFEVSPGDEQTFTINKKFELIFVDDKVKAEEMASQIVRECKTKATTKLAESAGDAAKTQEAMDDLVQCVEGGVASSLAKANEELAFQASIRKGMAEQMENYTCVDLEMDTTPALENKRWRSDKDRKMRNVQILFNRPSSKIHVIENFISQEECDAMSEAAEPRLHQATVADGKGGSHFSEHRKALQAGIRVHWEKEKNGDKIAQLSRRVYDYTNHVLNLNIQEHGQEDLMSIQYFGRGQNDTEPDRYTPHCDGDCDGLKHKDGTRMATIVMYCTVPENGGHTNFRNANVHVKPKKGSGVFFSYMDPETKIMDNGFTEHSGCPVYEGEKKIVTQWIRYGVDAENPWDSLNTLGIKLSEVEE
mmetsp:Transcript_33688/g.81667  ORF Transcript_33688/g.81667 Transcript_33688/m.81667 type:complete len:465 (+) Transcript_33688:359-1753(+)|eukprot:CAMPEP_0113634234 /NCGR_PEP_ID=MMETSP0017_2-20120614/17824_1 /TAXON_ID=2856 /ORGANISM="Cylindrotheca closterium" /LENGTH=464 /DNA_ID=CAMNT_0000544921 /DNA_START=169 /DNA_END=1563 /DNA_ORIENTATION=+ /assembly_acc=CAM_ASM_000147